MPDSVQHRLLGVLTCSRTSVTPRSINADDKARASQHLTFETGNLQLATCNSASTDAVLCAGAVCSAVNCRTQTGISAHWAQEATEPLHLKRSVQDEYAVALVLLGA
jgi:hypothetical protein